MNWNTHPFRLIRRREGRRRVFWRGFWPRKNRCTRFWNKRRLGSQLRSSWWCLRGETRKRMRKRLELIPRWERHWCGKWGRVWWYNKRMKKKITLEKVSSLREEEQQCYPMPMPFFSSWFCSVPLLWCICLCHAIPVLTFCHTYHFFFLFSHSPSFFLFFLYYFLFSLI